MNPLLPLLWGYDGLNLVSVLAKNALFLDECSPSPPVGIKWSGFWLSAKK